MDFAEAAAEIGIDVADLVRVSVWPGDRRGADLQTASSVDSPSKYTRTSCLKT
jgi:hypothetical protein